MVIVSDFTSNNGPDPLEAARQVKGSDQAIKIIAVGLGTESAGTNHRDISLRDIVTSPTVFVKNQLEVRGTVVAHGYTNQELNVELYVEGQATPGRQDHGEGQRRGRIGPDHRAQVRSADAGRKTAHAAR